MLVLLSPSKTLDEAPFTPPLPVTQPAFLSESQILIDTLKKISLEKLKKLMSISDKLAELNYQRFQHFHTPFTLSNAKPALYCFKGDVYEPLTLSEYQPDDVAFANAHLRILSGLYGVLRPLDLIQPYRLEMGIGLQTPRGRDLYAFWGERVTMAINHVLLDDLRLPESQRLVVNLASQEYAKAVKPELVQGTWIDVRFLDQKGGAAPKVLGLYAKQARGMMADFIVRQRVEHLDGLKSFCAQNYQYVAKLSSEKTLTFLRHHA